jgi:kynureninase
MRKDFKPIPGAEGWQLSNPPILSMAAIRASLDVFERAGFDNLRQKSKQLTGYLAFLVKQLNKPNIKIITPSHPDERGCQLSFQIKGANKSVFNALSKANVVADWREPDVIRIAPTPLYNSYTDVYNFIQRLKQVLA